MAEIVSQISEAVTCTLAKILCGAPAWFHEKHDDLTEAQKKILKAFYLDLIQIREKISKKRGNQF